MDFYVLGRSLSEGRMGSGLMEMNLGTWCLFFLLCVPVSSDQRTFLVSGNCGGISYMRVFCLVVGEKGVEGEILSCFILSAKVPHLEYVLNPIKSLYGLTFQHHPHRLTASCPLRSQDCKTRTSGIDDREPRRAF